MKKTVAVAIVSLLISSVGFTDTIINEKFSADPLQNGWQIFGDTNLFQWDSTNHVLDVTWDSTQPNSYFYHPLGVTLTTNDSFCVQFDLQLTNVTTSGSGNEIAIGLLHYSDATNADFNRANGPLPNLFEFDYFPAFVYAGELFSASVNATLKDSQPGYAGFYVVYDDVTMDPTVTYRVVLIHRAGEGVITGTIYTNGVVLSTLPLGYGSAPVGDFQLDTLSVSCFADDGYGDSVYAQGTVGNLTFASPLPVQSVQAIAAGQVQFTSDTNWLYTLEQSADLQTWTPAAPEFFGNGTNLVLQATNVPAGECFYRVRADLP